MSLRRNLYVVHEPGRHYVRGPIRTTPEEASADLDELEHPLDDDPDHWNRCDHCAADLYGEDAPASAPSPAVERVLEAPIAHLVCQREPHWTVIFSPTRPVLDDTWKVIPVFAGSLDPPAQRVLEAAMEWEETSERYRASLEIADASLGPTQIYDDVCEAEDVLAAAVAALRASRKAGGSDG